MGPEGAQEITKSESQEPSRLRQTVKVATLLTATLPGLSAFGAQEESNPFERVQDPIPAVLKLQLDAEPIVAQQDTEPAPAVITQEDLDKKIQAVDVLIQEAVEEYNRVIGFYPGRQGPLLESRVDALQQSRNNAAIGSLQNQFQQMTLLHEEVRSWKSSLIEYQQDEVILTGMKQELQDSTLIPFSYRVAERRRAIEAQRETAETLWKAADPAYVAALDTTRQSLQSYRQAFIASRAEVREMYREVRGLEQTLQTIEKESPYADSVTEEIAAAREVLQKVESSYRAGEEAFFNHAAEARVAVAHVEDTIVEAEQYKTYGQYLLWAAGIMGTLGLGALLSLGSRAKKANEEAKRTLTTEKEKLETYEQKFLSLYERGEEVYFDFDAHEYAGVTLGASENYTRTMATVLAHIGKLQDTHKDASESLKGRSMVSRVGNRFQKSGALQSAAAYTESRSFSPATAERVNLYGLSSDGFSLQFPPRVKDVQGTAAESKTAIEEGLKKAETILKEFTDKEEALSDSVKVQEEELTRLRHDHHKLLSLRSGIKAFRIGEDTKKAVKGLLQKSQELKRIGARDPLRAHQYAEVMEKRIHALKELTAVCLEGAYDCGVDITRGKKELEAAGVKADWVDKEISFLSSMSHAAVQTALRGEDPGHETIRKQLHLLEQKVFDLINDKAALGQAEERFASCVADLGPLEEALFERYGEEASLILQGDVINVLDVSDTVQAHFALVKAGLDSGDREGVLQALTEAEVELNRFTSALSIIRDTLIEFSDVHQSRQGTQKELAELLDSYRGKVAELHKHFEDSAFHMGKGDSSHPLPEKTLDDYLGETEQALTRSEEAMLDASEAFESGQLIKARQIMEHVFSLHEVAYSRFDEIFVKDDRLRRQHSVNVKNITELSSIAEAVDRQLEHDLVPTSVRKSVAGLQERLQVVLEALPKEDVPVQQKIDPEAMREEILELAQEYRNVQHAVLESRFTKADAEKAVKGLFEFLSTIEEELSIDSGAFSDRRAFARICTHQAALEKQIAAPHGEWRQIEEEAVSLYLEAAKIYGAIVGEQETADDVCQTLTKALEKRTELLQWQGDFGVRVRGNPGAEAFESALVNLTQGNLFGAEFDARQTLSAIEEASTVAKEHVAIEERKHEARLISFEAERELREEQEKRKQAVLGYNWKS